VVQLSFAAAENSVFIGRPIWGINSNWDGSSGDGCGQIVTVLDISESWNLEWSSSLWAGLFDSFVRILIFMNNSVVLDEFEGVVHKTSVAGLVSVFSWAVNELLFWEALKSSISEFAKTLESSGGGESPAWSALSLILNWSNGTLGNPINITNLQIVSAFDIVEVFRDNSSEVLLSKLFLG